MSQDEFYRKIGIPEGPYCYEVIDPIIEMGDNGNEFVAGHHIRKCPYWYGFRPDGGCLIYGWDPALGDACKACGWLDPEPESFEV